MRPLAVVVAALAAGACNLLEPDRHFPEAREYDHALFETHEACLEAQAHPDVWFNCSQIATFCPDGRAVLMVTDILNPATYSISANRVVTVHVGPSVELPQRVRFWKDASQDALILVGPGSVWVRRLGPDVEQSVASFCQ